MPSASAIRSSDWRSCPDCRRLLVHGLEARRGFGREHLRVGPPEDLPGGPADGRLHPRVDEQETPVQPLEGDGGRGVADETLEPGFAFAQLVDLGLHLLFEGFGQVLQGRLGRPLLGDVPGDLGETLQPAFGIPESGEDAVGHEAGAVLADPPALVLAAPFQGDLAQDFGRAADGQLLLREKAGEMPSQGFALGVAREPLRPGVPGGEPALGIHHEDRVIPDAGHQGAEAVLVFQPLPFRLPLGPGPAPARQHEQVESDGGAGEADEGVEHDPRGGWGAEGFRHDSPPRALIDASCRCRASFFEGP